MSKESRIFDLEERLIDHLPSEIIVKGNPCQKQKNKKLHNSKFLVRIRGFDIKF